MEFRGAGYVQAKGGWRTSVDTLSIVYSMEFSRNGTLITQLSKITEAKVVSMNNEQRIHPTSSLNLCNASNL